MVSAVTRGESPAGDMALLVRTSVPYFVSTAVTAAISFLSVPIYARGLGVEDYGNYMLVTTLFSVYNSILSLGLHSGLVRSHGLATTEEERGKINQTCLAAAVALAALNVILAWALGPWARLLLPLGSPQRSAHVLFLIGVWSAAEVVALNCLTLLRLDFKSLAYSAGTVAKAAVTVGAAYWLIIRLGRGVEGAALAQVAGSLSVACVLLVFQRRLLARPRFNPGELWDMLKFGLGLIPGNLAAWVLSLSDRYVIQYFLGPGAVGLYSMAYKVGTVIEVGIKNPFALAWSPVVFPAAREGRVVELIKRTFTYYNAVACFAALALGLFSREIILLLGGEEYAKAQAVVFLVALGLVVNGWPQFMAIGFNLVNKTYYFAIIFSLGGAINLGLNLWLVPRWGIYAAATTTLLSYILTGIAYWIVSRRYLRLQLDLIRNIVIFSVAIIAYTTPTALCWPVWARLLSPVFYCACLVLAGVVKVDEIVSVVFSQGKGCSGYRRKLYKNVRE